MTTSYELSLKLKELGVKQENGEYYWAFPLYRRVVHSKEQFLKTDDKICRAFTLGELVRMIKGVYLFDANPTHDGKWFAFVKTEQNTIDSGLFTSPEEAAGELLAEILKQNKNI